MTYTEFIQQLQKKIFHPVYLFTGEEDFLAEDGIRRLREELAAGRDATEIIRTFYAREAQELPGALNSSSLWSPEVVIIVKEAENLGGEALWSVVKFIEHPWEGITLILWENEVRRKRSSVKFTRRETKPGKSSAAISRSERGDEGNLSEPLEDIPFSGKEDWESIVRRLMPKIAVVECNPLTGAYRSQWLIGYLKSKGKSLTPEAKGRILTMEWGSIRELAQELDRLCLWVGEKEVIEERDLEGAGKTLLPTARYKIVDSLLLGEPQGLWKSCDNLLVWGIQPMQIISDLTRFFIRLWTIKRYLGSITRTPEGVQGKWESSVIKRLTDLPDFLIPRYVSAAQMWKSKAISDALEMIYTTERDFKTGEVTGEIGLYRVISELVHLMPQLNEVVV
ncbi:MAG: DNA polymerase III subunit delta [bacterium]